MHQMEIPLDTPFIREVLARERAAATRDVQAVGPIEALRKSQSRHDLRLASAPDAGTLDCRAGCTWCCHFSVDVRAVEVFAILDFVAGNFSSEALARLESQVRTNAAFLAGLDEEQRMTRNQRCAFLQEGRCSIYSVRPQTCRNYHATDVTGCKLSFDEPGNLDIDPDFAPYVYQGGGAHVEAFCEALRDAGYDVAAYELHGAVAAAMAQPEARHRFMERQPPFENIAGDDVYPEFHEIAEQPES
jgi:Fe-S-cluster containining protein